ncbi:MAG TPA: hypothetical protein VMS93_13555 [Candidatus Saccharimonadales bacterium]|nr:hypothetical protein [Candidatus Saccharimonadales bacterium]
MSLARVVVAGAVGGFLSILTSWLITGTLFHRFQRRTPETWRPEGPRQYALSSLIQVLAGAAVGVLFFATGGVARLGVTSWLPAGLLFGSLAWLALACPAHAINAVYVKLHRGVVVGLLLDSWVGLVLVSCACAWAAR